MFQTNVAAQILLAFSWVYLGMADLLIKRTHTELQGGNYFSFNNYSCFSDMTVLFYFSYYYNEIYSGQIVTVA